MNWVVLFDEKGLQSLVPVDRIKKEAVLMGSYRTLNGLVLRASLSQYDAELWFYTSEFSEDDMRNLWVNFPEEIKKIVREKGVNLKNKASEKIAEDVQEAFGLARELGSYWQPISFSWLQKTLERLKK